MKSTDGTVMSTDSNVMSTDSNTSKQNDRRLLLLAAKAAGYTIIGWNDLNEADVAVLSDGTYWQPLIKNHITDHMGDALRLAVKLRILGAPSMELAYIMALGSDNPDEATCRAIVRAAANVVGQDQSAALKIVLPLNTFEDDWDASGMDAYDDL